MNFLHRVSCCQQTWRRWRASPGRAARRPTPVTAWWSSPCRVQGRSPLWDVRCITSSQLINSSPPVSRVLPVKVDSIPAKSVHKPDDAVHKGLPSLWVRGHPWPLLRPRVPASDGKEGLNNHDINNVDIALDYWLSGLGSSALMHWTSCSCHTCSDPWKYNPTERSISLPLPVTSNIIWRKVKPGIIGHNLPSLIVHVCKAEIMRDNAKSINISTEQSY